MSLSRESAHHLVNYRQVRIVASAICPDEPRPALRRAVFHRLVTRRHSVSPNVSRRARESNYCEIMSELALVREDDSRRITATSNGSNFPMLPVRGDSRTAIEATQHRKRIVTTRFRCSTRPNVSSPHVFGVRHRKTYRQHA